MRPWLCDAFCSSPSSGNSLFAACPARAAGSAVRHTSACQERSDSGLCLSWPRPVFVVVVLKWKSGGGEAGGAVGGRAGALCKTSTRVPRGEGVGASVAAPGSGDLSHASPWRRRWRQRWRGDTTAAGFTGGAHFPGRWWLLHKHAEVVVTDSDACES